MNVIIKRGTYIPVRVKKTYEQLCDSEVSLFFNIYEGEKKYVKYNHFLKKVTIIGSIFRKERKKLVEIIFNIDVNGILNVEAQEKTDDGKVIKLLLS